MERFQTLSSAEPKKIKPIELPPMQVAAIPSSTVERLAQVKSTSSSSSSLSGQFRAPTTTALSRATSQTISSMQKQSDVVSRSRNQLPTIAGSPSVSVHGTNHVREKEQQLPTQNAALSGSFIKETPTRIPRIASRSSTVASPVLKANSSLLVSRRTSLNVAALGIQSSDYGITAGEESMNEFGVLDGQDNSNTRSHATSAYRHSIRSSPSSSSKALRQASGLNVTSSSGIVPRRSVQDPTSIKGLRKASTGSVSSIMSAANTDQHQQVSPSKGLNKLLNPKMSLPGTKLSGSSTVPSLHQRHANISPSPRRLSISTPSPVPSPIDEDEILGDEEMMQYIKRTQARKLANGAKKEDLDELLKFPEPLPPGRPSSPTGP